MGGANKVSIRPVKLGETVGNQWIVTEGVKPGERVVAEGSAEGSPGHAGQSKAVRGSDALKLQRSSQPCRNSSSTVRSWRW